MAACRAVTTTTNPYHPPRLEWPISVPPPPRKRARPRRGDPDNDVFVDERGQVPSYTVDRSWSEALYPRNGLSEARARKSLFGGRTNPPPSVATTAGGARTALPVHPRFTGPFFCGFGETTLIPRRCSISPEGANTPCGRRKLRRNRHPTMRFCGEPSM